MGNKDWGRKGCFFRRKDEPEKKKGDVRTATLSENFKSSRGSTEKCRKERAAPTKAAILTTEELAGIKKKDL